MTLQHVSAHAARNISTAPRDFEVIGYVRASDLELERIYTANAEAEALGIDNTDKEFDATEEGHLRSVGEDGSDAAAARRKSQGKGEGNR